MTSTTYEWQDEPTRGMGCTPWISLGIFVIAVALILGAMLYPTTQFVPSDHATDKHGDEALLVRDCMNNNGPYQTWKAQRGDRFFKICEIGPNEFGLQVVQFEEETEYEVTAFVPDDPSLRGVLDYLQKFATRYKGPLP